MSCANRMILALVFAAGFTSVAWGQDQNGPLLAPETLPPAASAKETLSLADLEQIALERNPTLVQAATQIDNSRAKALQAGLYPNPTIGYQGDVIGIKNEAGRSTAGEFQGGFHHLRAGRAEEDHIEIARSDLGQGRGRRRGL